MANYKVKKGENLSNIAKKFPVTVEAIKRINKLKSDTIHVNQLLQIPPLKTFIASKIEVKGKQAKVLPQALNKRLPVKTKYAPDSFGYSVEVNINGQLATLIGGAAKAGINYKVITSGKYAWYPWMYTYLGFSFNFISSKDFKEYFENLKNATKWKDILRTNVGFGVSASPFLAWKYNDSGDNLTPDSWTQWFSASTASLKLKAGVGFSFGGSFFVGISEKNKDQEWKQALNAKSLDLKYIQNPNERRWYGGTVDIGVGGGSPAFDLGLVFASFFWLIDKEQASSEISTIRYAQRWYLFLKGKGDSVSFWEKITGLKIPEPYRKLIVFALSFVKNEKIETIDDYELASNKEELDFKYKNYLENNGYNEDFFAKLENGEINEDYEIV